jgi:Raf kinase inhibitor-like YbhB/YbcL family protein
MHFIFINLIVLISSIMNPVNENKGVMPILVTSNGFVDNGPIPAKYTCQGENINPNIIIEEYPPRTKSLVLIVEDPDAPGATFDHWVLYNIMPTKEIKEKSAPGLQGQNGKGTNGYTGPCPPSGVHHYHFKVYALDAMLSIKAGAPKSTIDRAMNGHIIGYGEITGTYQKTNTTGKQ